MWDTGGERETDEESLSDGKGGLAVAALLDEEAESIVW